MLTLRLILLACLIPFAGASAQVADAELKALVAAAPGRVEGAGDVMALGMNATGTVQELLVKEGDRVAAGQVLVKLECRAIDYELAQRQSELDTADATLLKLKNGARPEEIAMAVANVRLSEARLAEAETAKRRIATLRETNAASQAQHDVVERDARVAAAQLAESQERLALLRAGTRAEELEEAKGRRSAAFSLVEQTRIRLDQCSLRSPSDGVVLSTHTTAGQLVSIMSPATLVRIVDDRKMRVRAEVDERDLPKICAGQRAVVTADGFPKLLVPARVERLNPGMGRRTILSGDPAEKSDRDVREVMLSVEGKDVPWPIGLRVIVRFAKCAS